VTPVTRAAEILLRGGVIAYPTEGVFGLGCLPDDQAALEKLLEIKQRDAAKGLILIAASAKQFAGWIDLPDNQAIPAPDPSHPITWIVPDCCSCNHKPDRESAVRGSRFAIGFDQRQPERQTHGS
jgi:L-threonylcarbamoyladenylate synthase